MRFWGKVIPAVAAISIGAALPAVAADLPIYQPPSPIEPVAVYKPWQGLSIGALGTYGFGKTELDRFGPLPARGPNSLNHSSLKTSGGLGGGLVGLHGQMDNWVLGAEFDGSFGDISKSRKSKGAGAFRAKSTIDQLYTVRGRLGYAMTPNTLLYGTGGIGIIHAKEKIRGRDFNVSGKGYAYTPVFGGGLEYKFSDTTSLRGEYLYASSFTKRFRDKSAPALLKAKFDGTHLIRIGLSYQIPAF
jgi:outer membrane immunogenic protein